MALIVQKYGGTSVGSIERIRHVADRIIATREQGHDVVVTVSAMSGETNRLDELAYQMVPNPSPREYSVMVSTGEQISMALLAMYLIDRGYQARSYTGGQARIITDDLYKKARILDIDPRVIEEDLAKGCIVIVAGFQGTDRSGNITTLGRGGSDTTGVALAAALKADECHIYTDVDGVYTADPRVVPEARHLAQVTFEEMLEMSSLGAKVLQRRAVEFAGRYQVPLRVMSSFNNGPGTLITFEDTRMEQPIVSGIAFNRNEAKLTIIGIPNQPSIAAKVLAPIAEADIDIDMIIQNISVQELTDFTFTVHRDEYDRAFAVAQSVAKELGAERVRGDTKIAKISLVGVGMRSHSGIAGTMFSILGDEGITIQLISTSEIKVSVVVDEKYLELGVRALHAGFGLDKEPKEEFDPVARTGANAS
ncbi:MAG: aspartate kinase [Legionellales bacterium]|nr:aspartate kinase [Legionellales bacterium]|tara:strand:+ start:6762 stop:8027 length:1266 start_codon:yes stop_codon:yes gene_type:complete